MPLVHAVAGGWEGCSSTGLRARSASNLSPRGTNWPPRPARCTDWPRSTAAPPGPIVRCAGSDSCSLSSRQLRSPTTGLCTTWETDLRPGHSVRRSLCPVCPSTSRPTTGTHHPVVRQLVLLLISCCRRVFRLEEEGTDYLAVVEGSGWAGRHNQPTSLGSLVVAVPPQPKPPSELEMLENGVCLGRAHGGASTKPHQSHAGTGRARCCCARAPVRPPRPHQALCGWIQSSLAFCCRRWRHWTVVFGHVRVHRCSSSWRGPAVASAAFATICVRCDRKTIRFAATLNGGLDVVWTRRARFRFFLSVCLLLLVAV